MPDLDINSLAEKLAKILKEEETAPDKKTLERSLIRITQRLDDIERRLASNPQTAAHNLQSIHPSLQKFDVIEAIADQIIENQEQEKACTFEPNGKPCDHCSMCSSRGF